VEDIWIYQRRSSFTLCLAPWEHCWQPATCQRGINSCDDVVVLARLSMRDVSITHLLSFTKIMWHGGRRAFQSRQAVAGRSKSPRFYMAVWLAKTLFCGPVFTPWAHSLICQTVIMPILIIHNESVMQSKTWLPGRYYRWCTYFLCAYKSANFLSKEHC